MLRFDFDLYVASCHISNGFAIIIPTGITNKEW